MRKIIFLVVFLTLTSCATSKKYNKDIPMHLLSIGMNKTQVVSELGQPHRVVGAKMSGGVTYDTWMYEKNEKIWLTGNAFLGGTVRNDRTIYLLEFADNRLARWRDNAMQKNTKSENTYELRKR